MNIWVISRGESHRTLTSKSCWNSIQNRVKSLHFSKQKFNVPSPQSEWQNKVQATAFRKKKIKQAKKIQLQPAASPESPACIREHPTVHRWQKRKSGSQSTAGPTAFPSVPWLVPRLQPHSARFRLMGYASLRVLSRNRKIHFCPMRAGGGEAKKCS